MVKKEASKREKKLRRLLINEKRQNKKTCTSFAKNTYMFPAKDVHVFLTSSTNRLPDLGFVGIRFQEITAQEFPVFLDDRLSPLRTDQTRRPSIGQHTPFYQFL